MDLSDDSELIVGAGLLPMLGLVARSVETDLEVLPLPSIRVLVELSHGHSMSVRQLSHAISLPVRAILSMLDGLEADGWIYTAVHARGVVERISITAQGRDLVDRMTERRQREIDAILRRMTDTSRNQLTRAFTSFAAAAGEQTVDRPRKGIAP